MPEEPPLTGRGARTREKLVATAREVFEENGFLDTRVAHVSERAGVAYGTFYTYFASKEEIFFEIADRLFADMSRLEHDPAGPAAEQIRLANRSFYRAYLRNARMLAIVEQVATLNTDFRQIRRKHRAAWVGHSARSIERWQAEGTVDPTLDPELTALALAAMVDHTIYLWLVQDEADTAPAALLDTLDTLTLRALGL